MSDAFYTLLALDTNTAMLKLISLVANELGGHVVHFNCVGSHKRTAAVC